MAQLIETARIGNEPTLRYTPDGTAVINLSLPCDYGKKGADGKKPTQWLDASLWAKRAEALAPYLVKSQWVAVTVDDVHIETYEGRNGAGHKLVGRISEIKLVGPAPEQNQEARQPAKQDDGWGDFGDSDIPI
jgi:single-strand DNA-binding protein